ncbi:hypothetical protein SAMN02745116_01964 [Pilibacter termitis]|jgi:hypothetical protein|uniref:Uncharacterized protein n=1 Tax=Pilibacter termitis TaxID=263852 RepID=A0A1T4PWT8_9ENTE|nr:hypothetical protein [Pilibacter termitis]SJZ95972.1 hypothetical protein SAMN02745116_01964 [Pilibacter termitis]
MNQEIKKFKANGITALIEKVSQYAEENKLTIVSISHERSNSVMGDEIRAIVVFNK